MIYSENYRTTWHDTDCNRAVRPTPILTYFEETSNLHMIAVGEPLDKIRDKAGLGFILSRLTMKFYKPLEAYKNIKVETWTSEGRAFSTIRSFRLLDGDSVVAEAYTLWALVDINERKPVKISSYDFGFSHEPPVEVDAPSRVAFPKDITLEKVGERKIFYSDCDYNMHMNNTRYPDMLCDFLPSPENMKVSSMTLSFVREAAMGHTLSVYRANKDENTYIFRTADEEGNTCLEAEVTVE